MSRRLAMHLLLCLALLASGVASTVHVTGHQLRHEAVAAFAEHPAGAHEHHGAHEGHGARDVPDASEHSACLAYHLFCAAHGGIMPSPGVSDVPRADAPPTLAPTTIVASRRAFATPIRGPPALS